MKIGFIGLGKMGSNMVLRLKNKKDAVVFDKNQDNIKKMAKHGVKTAYTIEQFMNALGNKKIVWIMVPHDAVDDVIKEILPFMHKDDILVDGGNSNFNKSISRHDEMAKHNIRFLDVGVSGGITAAKVGYCMMIGGDNTAYKEIEPYVKAMCIPGGYGYMGPSGSGHYVKMVHNAIEYGMMEALGEGYELLSRGPYKSLDLLDISKVWNNGSIIRGFLMEMTINSFMHHPGLKSVSGYVADNGEGMWSVQEAMKYNVPFTVNTQALFSRYRSREIQTIANKLVAAMRDEFGGHGLGKK